MIYIWAKDNFLSGWGEAEGKSHVQVVECPTEEEAARIWRGFYNSKKMKSDVCLGCKTGLREFGYPHRSDRMPKLNFPWFTYTVRPSSEFTRDDFA